MQEPTFGHVERMAVNPVHAISTMVAPVVLISVGIIIMNGLIASYSALVDRSKVGKVGELETDPLKKMARRIAFAILLDLSATACFMGSVLFIALAESSLSDGSELAGRIAVWCIVAGIDLMFIAIVIVGLAYRGGSGLLAHAKARTEPRPNCCKRERRKSPAVCIVLGENQIWRILTRRGRPELW
jgi:hypothetical protein